MSDFTLIFIILCIAVQAGFWITSAFSVKRTSENKGGWGMRIIAIIVVILLISFRQQISMLFLINGDNLYGHSLITGTIADVVVLLGVAFMIWARVTLGKNWSANITFKENHELITTGPYSYVRHPIYSGLLLIILGLAIYSGSFIGFLLFVIFFFGAYYKAHREESLLIKYFSEDYLEYKKRVHALIPFVF